MNVNFKKYIGTVLVLCLLVALISLAACKEKDETPEVMTPMDEVQTTPEETTPEQTNSEETTPEETTPNETTPDETTPTNPAETTTVAFPSDEETDPKQEDVFFD